MLPRGAGVAVAAAAAAAASATGSALAAVSRSRVCSVGGGMAPCSAHSTKKASTSGST
jgi:hypothetical protein